MTNKQLSSLLEVLKILILQTSDKQKLIDFINQIQAKLHN